MSIAVVIVTIVVTIVVAIIVTIVVTVILIVKIRSFSPSLLSSPPSPSLPLILPSPLSILTHQTFTYSLSNTRWQKKINTSITPERTMEVEVLTRF